ncbi:Outer membrane lipoprotein [hydrothermal vent metagenome]|uniref:Outer membrane lipoprotein n=1 Tax=hydrothermal vent metagenome TaxID=652676 RepID=A0A1W1C221_9ZZZZ
MRNIFLLFLLSSLLFSCSSVKRFIGESEDANTYNSGEVGKLANVLEGRIIAIREVTIAGSKGIGATTGAAIGAAAGSNVSPASTDKAIGAGLGAIAGGLLGGIFEEKLTEKKGWEFVILLKSGKKTSFVQNPNQELKVGDNVYIVQSENQVRITKINP